MKSAKGDRMNGYIKNLGTVMMMVAIANILMPEGSIKKFAALSMGFIMITAAIAPVGQIFDKTEFSIETFSADEKNLSEAEKGYREEVFKQHRENIREKINENIRHGSEVTVEVSEDGSLTGVSITLRGDESAAVKYIVDTLKLPRERIKLNYENN